MKLPDAIGSILGGKQKKKEVFLSLVVDVDYLVGGCFHMGPKGEPVLTHAVSRKIKGTSWEEKIAAGDEVIGALEEKSQTQDIHKVILGLPASFLTPTGDIQPEIRPELKTLTHKLDITPVGFVALHQAIVYKLKHDEGVPPTVILIGVAGGVLTVTLYKVGNLIGQAFGAKGDMPVVAIERALKGFSDIEVLPSRMLLYGGDSTLLLSLKEELTRYPWPTKANFLHFPKIDVLPPDVPVGSVSLAGASELAKDMGTDTAIVDDQDVSADTGESDAIRDQEEHTGKSDIISQEISDQADEVAAEAEEKGGTNAQESEEDINEADDQEDDEDDEDEDEDEDAVDEEQEREEDGESNVRMVSAEELGFQKNVDVIAHPPKTGRGDNAQISTPEKIHEKKKYTFPAITLPALFTTKGAPLTLLKNKFVLAIGLALIVVIAIIFTLLNTLPRATVTIHVVPKTFEDGAVVIIDPKAESVDTENAVIPGKKQEKAVSGEKTIPVTGKKEVGDPAKGTTTIYNKSLSAKTFKKGNVLSSGKLQFTLDNDVQVASASESIGSITFGKANVAITASQIGSESNLPANTELTFKDTDSSVAVGRNDQAFSGGTSREVTVVTRADYDELVSQVTEELLEKAKGELASAVTGSLKLIEGTIKTQVSERKFLQELDEEAKELHGTVTLTVSGIAYDEAELQILLDGAIAKNVPSGYTLVQERLETSLSKPQVKRDGKITADVTMRGSAVPNIDEKEVTAQIAGKKIDEVKEILKQITGIAQAEFSFRYAVFKDRLPNASDHISVAISISE